MVSFPLYYRCHHKSIYIACYCHAIAHTILYRERSAFHPLADTLFRFRQLLYSSRRIFYPSSQDHQHLSKQLHSSYHMVKHYLLVLILCHCHYHHKLVCVSRSELA